MNTPSEPPLGAEDGPRHTGGLATIQENTRAHQKRSSARSWRPCLRARSQTAPRPRVEFVGRTVARVKIHGGGVTLTRLAYESRKSGCHETFAVRFYSRSAGRSRFGRTDRFIE